MDGSNVMDTAYDEFGHSNIKFNIDEYHFHNHSLVNLFQNSIKEKYLEQQEIYKINENYQPRFVIINWDFSLVEVENDAPRNEMDLCNLINAIQAMGGKVSLGCEELHEINYSIPILFLSNDKQLNPMAAAAWRAKQKDEHGMPPRDVFSELYCTRCIQGGELVDLNKFRIGETSFYPYNANDFLEGRGDWFQMQPLHQYYS